jgi:four helix bundle protein
MSNYHKLEVWKLAHALVLKVHVAAKAIRGAEYTSLRSQMVRSAMSIPTNLVEGSAQESVREFCRFIKISINSAAELEYHLLLAKDFEVMKQEPFTTLTDQTIKVRKMLWGLLRGVSRRTQTTKPELLNPQPSTRNS